MICIVSLILFVGAQDFYLVMCTKVSIAKWRDGNKITNFDGHSEIMDRFMIFQIFFGICLIDCVIPLFLRGI